MNIRKEQPGYKLTSLGWLPEEWDVKRFDEVAEINPLRQKVEDNVFVTFLTMSDVSENGQVANEKVVPYSTVKNGFTPFADNDILIAKITPCFENGKGAFVRNLKNGIGFGSTEFHVVRAKETILPEIIFYHTRLHEFRESGEHNMTGSAGQKRVPTLFLESYKIPLPPLSEQRRISVLLSAWNIAIETEYRLIATLQARNRALVQLLLTGKYRFIGFNASWKETPLGHAFDFIKSYSVPRDGLTKEAIGSNTYCVHYGDIHAYYQSEFLDFSLQKNIPQLLDATGINEEDFLKEGDVIMADASEDYEGVGEAVEVINLSGKKAVGGLHTIVLRDKAGNTSNGFRAYLFASEHVRNQMRKLATGTSVYSITKSTLQKVNLNLPPVDEQLAIAAVLTKSDKEISTHQAHLSALQTQKRGLMQQLLTGALRVKLTT